MKKTLALVFAILLLAVSLVGCGGAGGEKTTIHLLNWGEYLEPTLIDQFQKENPDIIVKFTNTTSNEEMYTVCATEGTEIDIVVPSDYLVERFINEGLLAELDLNNIPNFKYVEEVSKTRTFDPESKYSIPYMMGTVGIVYNKTLVDEPVDSWDILWDEKYSGQILMYDSIRDSMMVALAKLGYDINSTDPEEIAKAGELLMQQKSLVYAYLTDEIRTSMIGGSVALAVDYSGAAVGAIQENSDLDYVVPKEGSNVWVDNLVVLKSSKNKEAAERFINFLCDPEVSKKNSEYIGYTTPNAEAMKMIDPELLENPAYPISSDVLDRCEYYKDLGDDLSLYNDVWMKLRTAG